MFDWILITCDGIEYYFDDDFIQLEYVNYN